MLNSYDNPECAGCKNCRVVGCGTKLVDGRRTHITLYNCARNGALTCTSCNEKAAACGSNTDNGNR